MAIMFQHLAQAANGDTEITGTGVRVYTILGLYEVGEAPEYIAEQRDLPLAAVYEALAYAAEHPEEMEAIRRADEAAAQQLLNTLPEDLRREAALIHAADEAVRQDAIKRTRDARRGSALS